MYHKACIVNFRTRKQIPKKHGGYTDSKHAKGRPTDTVKSKVFLKETEALVESGKEQFSRNTLSCWEDARVSLGNWGMPPTVLYTWKKSYGNTLAKK